MLAFKVYGVKQDGSTMEGGHPWMLADSAVNPRYKFPAYRAHVPDMKHKPDMLGYAEGFNSAKPSKVIITKKGMPLLVNCPEEQDEHIVLMTAYGPFRGGVHSVFRLSGDIKIVGRISSASTKNCAPQWNAVLRGEGDLLIVYSTRNNGTFLELNDKKVTLSEIVDKYGLDHEVVNLIDEASVNEYWQEQAKEPIRETYWGRKYKS